MIPVDRFHHSRFRVVQKVPNRPEVIVFDLVGTFTWRHGGGENHIGAMKIAERRNGQISLLKVH